MREHQNMQVVRLSNLEKKLLEEKTIREKLEAMNQELKYIVNQQSEKMKSLYDSNVQLQCSLQKAQIDVLNTSDTTFDRVKD